MQVHLESLDLHQRSVPKSDLHWKVKQGEAYYTILSFNFDLEGCCTFFYTYVFPKVYLYPSGFKIRLDKTLSSLVWPHGWLFDLLQSLPTWIVMSSCEPVNLFAFQFCTTISPFGFECVWLEVGCDHKGDVCLHIPFWCFLLNLLCISSIWWISLCKHVPSSASKVPHRPDMSQSSNT